MQIPGFPRGSKVKYPPATKETRLRPLWVKSPLDEGMGTYSSTLQENPMDRGAWWATVHWVAESGTTAPTEHTGIHVSSSFPRTTEPRTQG